MVMPTMKLRKKMILMGIDFGSSQLPWAIQEPQIINQEFRGVKEPGLCLFSLPKKYANVSRVEKVRRRKERAIQSVVEKGSRKVNQLTSRPGNWTKNLVATVLSPKLHYLLSLLLKIELVICLQGLLFHPNISDETKAT